MSKHPTLGEGYNVGLYIHAAGGAIKIGPFFGHLNAAANRDKLEVVINTPALNGTVTLTHKKNWELTIKAKLEGIASGNTGVAKDVWKGEKK